MRIFLVLVSTIFLFTNITISLAADGPIIDIDISKNTNSQAPCSKLLSALSIQKTLTFVFSENFERRESDVTVNYKNLVNEDRKLSMELTRDIDELSIIIKKGLFKNLFLKLNYKQTKYCEVKGHLSW